SAAGPHQHLAIFIHSLVFRLDNFVFERFEVVIIQVEAELESSIGYTSLALKQMEYLRQELLKCHRRPSSYPCHRTRAQSGDCETFFAGHHMAHGQQRKGKSSAW